MASGASRSGFGRVPRLIQVGFLVGLLALWVAATNLGHVSPFLLPPPGAVAVSLWGLLSSGTFLPGLETTLFELVVAFGASTICGLAIGFAISRSRYCVRTFEPLLSSLYAVPVILFLPLFLLIFGLGVGSKIAMGIATSFFPITLSAIAGFANVAPIFLATARSMGASNLQLFRRVLLPAALPVVVTGLRMGFIVAFLSILGAEAIASYAGLGHDIIQHAQNLETREMFAEIVLVIVISSGLNVALSVVERRLGER